MPCRKRMIGCRPGCLHREMVSDYQMERERQEAQAEEQEWRERDGNPRSVPLITFKKWLTGRRRHDRTD